MSMHSRRLPGGDKTEDMTGGGGGDRRLYARSFIDTNIRARLGREILFALYIFTVMITLFGFGEPSDASLVVWLDGKLVGCFTQPQSPPALKNHQTAVMFCLQVAPIFRYWSSILNQPAENNIFLLVFLPPLSLFSSNG